MAFCKVARHTRQTRSRGFCQMAQAAHEPGWSDVCASLEEHVTGPGKALLPALKFMIGDLKKQMEDLKKERLKEVEDLKKERLKEVEERLKEVEYLKKLSEKDGVIIARLETSELRAQLDLLKLQGLNNARGLFEKIQEQLSSTLPSSKKSLKGADLWEAILKRHALLGTCIEKHTKVRATDVSKQAVHIYHIYAVLSQHMHSGKELAELQAGRGATILFQRGPFSPEQVRIFQCMGDVARFRIAEDPQTMPH